MYDVKAKAAETEDAENGERTGDTEDNGGSGNDKEDTVSDKVGVSEDVDEGMHRVPKAGRIPRTPTQKEVEEHEPLHVDYKDWCPICVAGEGNHDHHRKIHDEDPEARGITLSMDYCFLSPDDEPAERPNVFIMCGGRLHVSWHG